MFTTNVTLKNTDVLDKVRKTCNKVDMSDDKIAFTVASRIQSKSKMYAPRVSGRLQTGIIMFKLNRGKYVIESSAIRPKRYTEDKHGGFDYARVVEGEPLGRMRTVRAFAPRQYMYRALTETLADTKGLVEFEIHNIIIKNK